jgi:hypothetical protein
VIADAALAARHREVVAERRAEGRRAALDDARARGRSWVVLETSGDPAGDPLAPYRRLEAHASTGHAVLVTTAPDDELLRTVHCIEAVLVDLATGALRELPGERVPHTTHLDSQDRERQVAALQQRLAQL